MSDLTRIENEFVGVINDTVIYGDENDIFRQGPSKDEIIKVGNRIISKKL